MGKHKVKTQVVLNLSTEAKDCRRDTRNLCCVRLPTAQPTKAHLGFCCPVEVCTTFAFFPSAGRRQTTFLYQPGITGRTARHELSAKQKPGWNNCWYRLKLSRQFSLATKSVHSWVHFSKSLQTKKKLTCRFEFLGRRFDRDIFIATKTQ